MLQCVESFKSYYRQELPSYSMRLYSKSTSYFSITEADDPTCGGYGDEAYI